MSISRSRSAHYRPRVLALEGRLLPSTFVVTNTDDSGPGSLRQAILDSNAETQPNTITFVIGDGGVQTIHPASPLPAISTPVLIDGTSQPGYAGTPLIELAGPGANSAMDGLTIPGGSSTVQGLDIHDFRYGIYLNTFGDDVLAGNYLGTDPSGEVAEPNLRGVYVVASPDNTIGGTASGQGNVVSGNLQDGINAVQSFGLVIQGNDIGTDAAGTVTLGNGAGVTTQASFSGALIGGTDPGAGNLISGNGKGLNLGGAGDLVEGNLIGTDITGTVPLGNGQGVHIDINGNGRNTIGGTAAGAGNLISGNGFGIESDDGVNLNVIQGNLIGTDVSGEFAVGNGIGIDLGSSGNQIGGTDSGAGNVISGNRGDGILVIGANNRYQGNRIGTDASGTQPLGNGGDGIELFEEGINNTIGGTAPGAGNVISANGGDGIFSGLHGTLIQGNLIGVDVTGVDPLGNGGNGVNLGTARGEWAASNTVGGTAPGAANVIAYSGLDGVRVDSVPNSQDAILGNSIYASGHLGLELLNNSNNNQAAPLLTSAVVDQDSITITGTLQSAPDTAYTLEFFGNDVCNPSGYGEGQRLLGDAAVTTGDDGTGAFTVTLPLNGVDPGGFISATATDPAGNTSAFAACVAVSGPADPLAGLGMGAPVASTPAGPVPGPSVRAPVLTEPHAPDRPQGTHRLPLPTATSRPARGSSPREDFSILAGLLPGED